MSELIGVGRSLQELALDEAHRIEAIDPELGLAIFNGAYFHLMLTAAMDTSPLNQKAIQTVDRCVRNSIDKSQSLYPSGRKH